MAPETLHKTLKNKRRTRKWSSGLFRVSTVWLQASPLLPHFNKEKSDLAGRGESPRRRKAQPHCSPQPLYIQNMEAIAPDFSFR